MSALRNVLVACAVFILWQWSSATNAAACGGFFCDSGPTAMPVDQTGENIIFVTNGGNVEAHIQIQYTGDPLKFAWVIPIQSLPQFSVGSQALFDALLQDSVPLILRTNSFSCRNGSSGGGGGTSFAGGSGGSSGGPQVLSREQVGSFDVTVLQGGTAAEVLDWLNTNGYAQDPEAEPILTQYLSANYMFAAVKLTGGRGLEDLHPLVFTSAAARPCVPLKLTRIASVPNMGIRTLFLGDRRVVPVKYAHVELNQVQLNWLNLGANYRNVVSQAVDDPAAGGRAFVTEFAGMHAGQPGRVRDPSWDATPFRTISVLDVITGLSSQGLVFCTFGDTCQWNHPLLRGLVNKYIPVPATLTERAFYADLAAYSAQVDMTAWSATGFADEFDLLVVQPGEHAAQLLTQQPYLTRLFTLMDGNEMTEDPEFETRSGLPDVPRALTANVNVSCSGSVVTTPDGHVVNAPFGSIWPEIANMPFARRVQLFPPDGSGAPVTLADRSDTIQALLDAHNAANPVVTGASSGTGSTGGNATSARASGSAGVSNSAGASNPAVSQPGSASSDSGSNPAGPRFNCLCSGSTGGQQYTALLLGMWAWWVARRRGSVRDPGVAERRWMC